MRDGDSQSELIGRVIGRDYRVEARLGRGGMGAVFRVTQVSTGRPAALKVIHPHLVDADMRARFRQESAALGRLNHPHVVTVYTYGQEDSEHGLVYLAMELVKGRSLQELLEAEAPLTLPRALTIATQICEALAFAHGERIVHRDLKPRNVMVTPVLDREVVKLLDFGLAKVLDDQFIETISGQIMGSPPYMAPEQWEEVAEIDGRADIYAFGCIFYLMLTGTLPFVADTTLGYMKAHLGTRPRSPTSLRPELAAYPEVLMALERCLARDRRERWPDSATLLTQLRQLELRSRSEALESEPRATVEQLAMTPTPAAWSEHDFETEPPSALGPGMGHALAETVSSPPPGPDQAAVDTPEARTQRSRWPLVALFGVLALGAGAWLATGGTTAESPASPEVTERVAAPLAEPDGSANEGLRGGAEVRSAAPADVAPELGADVPVESGPSEVSAAVRDVAGEAETAAAVQVRVVTKPARAVVKVNGTRVRGGVFEIAPGSSARVEISARGYKTVVRTLAFDETGSLPAGELKVKLPRKGGQNKPPDPDTTTGEGPGLNLNVVPPPK